MVMTLCQLLFARGRYKPECFLSVCIIAVTLNFSTLKLHSLLKFDSKEKFIWFCYLVVLITQHFSFCKRLGLPVLPVFGSKNNAVQYRSLRWVKSHEKTEL